MSDLASDRDGTPSPRNGQGIAASWAWWGAGGLITNVFLMIITWLAVNAVWSLTGSDATAASRWVEAMVPLPWGVAGAALLLIAATAIAARREKGLAFPRAMLLGYLVGVLVSRWALHAYGPVTPPLRSFWDAGALLLHRSFFLLQILPMTAVFLVFRRQDAVNPFRWGRWSKETATGGGPALDWARLFVGWSALMAVVALAMQAAVGFMPVRSGRIWGLVVPLALLALMNALAEEVSYRGLFFSAFASIHGLRPALALQAAYFGLHHWGSSPHYVATLPAAALTALLGWWWGRSVIGTRGLAWAVFAHMLLDLAFFTAQFVATS